MPATAVWKSDQRSTREQPEREQTRTAICDVLRLRVRVVGWISNEELVSEDAESPQVDGARVDFVLPSSDLGREVDRRAAVGRASVADVER